MMRSVTIEWFPEEHLFQIIILTPFGFRQYLELDHNTAEELHKKLEVALREADEEREIPDKDIDPWTHNMEGFT